MHSEFSEQKLLEGSVGYKKRICYRNKCQMTHLLLTQLPRYKRVLLRELKYQLLGKQHFVY